MKTQTYTLLVTITAEPGHLAFDTAALADIVAGALEIGQKRVVVKGAPDVAVPSVASAAASALLGDALRFPHDAHDPAKAVKKLHAALRDAPTSLDRLAQAVRAD